jgi:hypothetical protein
MNKYFDSFKQQSVDYSEDAMESRNHFKNGASPKSHTSKRNLKLLTLFALIAGAVTFVSCGKGDDDNVPADIEGMCCSGSNPENSSLSLTLSFENNGEVYITYQHYDYAYANPSVYYHSVDEIVKGSYTYSKPNVTVSVDGKQWTGQMEDGTPGNPTLIVAVEGRDIRFASYYGCGDYSPQQPLSTPANVSAVKSGSRIAISWNSVPLATGYKVYRGSSRWNLDRCLDNSVHNTTVIYDEAPYSEDNYYWVIAYNSNGESNLSHYAYCNYTSGANSGDPGTDPDPGTGAGNVYVGVMGFHGELMPFAVTNNLTSVKNFINSLQNNQD